MKKQRIGTKNFSSRRDCLKKLSFLAFTGLMTPRAFALGQSKVPDWVVYPQNEWVKISVEEAGFDVEKLQTVLDYSNIRPGVHWGMGNVPPNENEWGAVLTRGGYLVKAWGDLSYKNQSASLGKCLTRAIVGLAVDAGLIKADDPIQKTWTGEGQLSYPHQYLNRGYHRTLTWRNLLDHQGGFVLESGVHWRTKTGFFHESTLYFKNHAYTPAWAKWTGDPIYDNYAHTQPGTVRSYSSGGYWRLGQALTALWNQDLKKVIDEMLLIHLGIRAENWDWTPGKVLYDRKDFYPAMPRYGEYCDPPWEISGHIVRGGPGWIVMSASDLARFGLLIASGGIWKGKRLISSEWVRGHGGTATNVVGGDPETFVSIAKINTLGFPFGNEIGSRGLFPFPKVLIAGPVGKANRK